MVLVKNHEYPLFISEGQYGTVLTINRDQISKDEKMYLRLTSCDQTVQPGSVEIKYHTNGQKNDRAELGPSGATLIQLDNDQDTQMVTIKISKDSKQQALWINLRLYSIRAGH